MIEVESPFFIVGQTILHQIGQEFYWIYGITPYWGLVIECYEEEQ